MPAEIRIGSPTSAYGMTRPGPPSPAPDLARAARHSIVQYSIGGPYRFSGILAITIRSLAAC
eukprot:7794010-Heterocapsa_arctica.AAC.1